MYGNQNDEMTTLTLSASVDGVSFHDIAFSGESPKYVDAQALAYITTYKDMLTIELDQETAWSDFPNTFNAIARQAAAAEPAIAYQI